MDSVVVNISSASLREETLQGRCYIVATGTLINPGVLPGSQGPLFYPADVVSKNPSLWDGMPLVGYHPTTKGGDPVSARSPKILDKQGLGFIFNTFFQEKLKTEYWFDKELTEKFDQLLQPEHRIIPRLYAKVPISSSTGLFTANEEAPAGSNYNGIEYKATVRHIRPDHVAVLPNKAGACTIEDGCGILVNHFVSNHGVQTMLLTPEQRTAIVTKLTTNCACWKGPNDRAVLNTLSDDQLQTLDKAADPTPTPVPIPIAPPVPNPLPLTTQQVDQLAAILVEKLKPTTPAPTITPPVPTPATAPVLTANDWLNQAPPEIRSVFTLAANSLNDKKKEVVDQLVANIGDDAQKKLTVDFLMRKELSELELMRTLMPPAPSMFGSTHGSSFFLGGGGAPVINQGASPQVDDELLIPPTLDYEALAKERRAS